MVPQNKPRWIQLDEWDFGSVQTSVLTGVESEGQKPHRSEIPYPPYLKTQMLTWKQQYQGVEEMKVAVMGCVVNGPGESKHANIGISLPGTGEAPIAPVYIDGNKATTLKGENIAEEFKSILQTYVAEHYTTI